MLRKCQKQDRFGCQRLRLPTSLQLSCSQNRGTIPTSAKSEHHTVHNKQPVRFQVGHNHGGKACQRQGTVVDPQGIDVRSVRQPTADETGHNVDDAQDRDQHGGLGLAVPQPLSIAGQIYERDKKSERMTA